MAARRKHSDQAHRLQAAFLPASSRRAMAVAAAALRRGKVVAFPTETVYGLAVRMNDRAARTRLARLKGRLKSKPFQILLSSPRNAQKFCGPMPPLARRLASAFWPGPLTLVVKGLKGRWVGLRVPDHPVAQKLARLAGGALVATSANPSGQPAASTAREVRDTLGSRIDVILDAGTAGLSKPSSVVRVWKDRWELLRPGAIAQQAIIRVTGLPPARKGRES